MGETTEAVAAPPAEGERAPRPRHFYTEPDWIDVRRRARRLPAQGHR